MKKCLLSVLSLFMLCSLSSCGDSNSLPSPNKPDSNQQENETIDHIYNSAFKEILNENITLNECAKEFDESILNNYRINIVYKNVENNVFAYGFDGVGRNGAIKLATVIKDNHFMGLKVIEHSETASYFEKIDANYFSQFNMDIKDSGNLDIVAGATFSSSAINAAINNIAKFHSEYCSK